MAFCDCGLCGKETAVIIEDRWCCGGCRKHHDKKCHKKRHDDCWEDIEWSKCGHWDKKKKECDHHKKEKKECDHHKKEKKRPLCECKRHKKKKLPCEHHKKKKFPCDDHKKKRRCEDDCCFDIVVVNQGNQQNNGFPIASPQACGCLTLIGALEGLLVSVTPTPAQVQLVITQFAQPYINCRTSTGLIGGLDVTSLQAWINYETNVVVPPFTLDLTGRSLLTTALFQVRAVCVRFCPQSCCRQRCGEKRRCEDRFFPGQGQCGNGFFPGFNNGLQFLNGVNSGLPFFPGQTLGDCDCLPRRRTCCC